MQTTNTIGVTINAAKTIAGRDITQSGVIKSVSANNNVSTPAVPITAYGTGSDGAITIAATKNLNTDTLATGRTCADAVNYSITTLTTNSATLSTTPPAGCLVAGDEMLLINLQGISSNYTNVGNYETLKILSISTNTITFTANKSKYYGNGVSDDTNIGTTTSNQRVMLQRVPNYTNVTINTGITLTASAWDGTKGGVLFFKASGAVANSGIINMSQNGYQGGVVGTLGFDWIGGKWTSKGNNGDAGGNAGMPGGGAGGAGGNSTIVNPATVVAATTTGSSTGGIAGGGGGGTGNYNSGGQGKCGGGGGAGGSWSSDVSVAGAGGGGCPYKMDTTDSYNITDTGITRISFGVGSATGGGSGGSGGASWPGTSTGGGGGLANGTGGTPGTGVNVPPAGANGTNGSSGGGIIMIYASTLTSGSQSIVSNGGNGGNGGGATTSWINPGNGGGAGSQGASGGTVIINSTSSVALSVALVKGGSGGSTDTGLSGGAGGAGATYVSGNDKGSVGGAGVNRNGYSASGGGGGGGSSGYAGKTVGLF
jgi:hypothetical protein